MPKNPQDRKGKQPLRPMRGPDWRWVRRPDPEPPDGQGARAPRTTPIDEMPVTAGGLVIREPNPRPRALERSANPTLSSEAGALILRLASVTGWADALQFPPHCNSHPPGRGVCSLMTKPRYEE